MKSDFGKFTGRRVFSIFLSMALLISMFVIYPVSAANTAAAIWDGSADTEYEGTGTKEDPYRITTAEELYGFSSNTDFTLENSKDKYYVLTKDIYLNDVTAGNWLSNNPREWASNYKYQWAAHGFAGHFDGQGHTVYGVYYKNYTVNYSYGLIPKAVGNAEITNVNLRYAYAESNGSTNIHFGGIVGFIDRNNDNYASGYQANVKITKCVVDETVDLSNLTGLIGGIVGPVRESKVTVQYCGSAAKFNSYGNPAGNGGGIICAPGNWAAESVKILNSYSVVAFTCGWLNAIKPADISDGTLYSTQSWWATSGGVNLTPVDGSAAMFGDAAKVNMPNLGWDVWQANKGAYPTIQGSTAFIKPEYEVWDGTAAAAYDGGTGEAGDPYLIATPEQLRKMVETSETGKYYLLTSNIYLNDITLYKSWGMSAPAHNWWTWERNETPFRGHIDGNGHTIYGLYSANDNLSGNKYAGLIANIGADSSITDLHIRKSYINGVWAAAFVGATNGTAGISSGEVVISGCSADDTVQVTGTRTAGIIGCALAKITISDSYSSAVLGGTATKGGAYADVWGGYANITIKDFYTYGWHTAAVNLQSSNWECKIPGAYSFSNAYYIGFDRDSWEGLVKASGYSDLKFDSDAWYGTGEKLLKNRGLRNYDVNAEDSDAPDAGDVTMLKKIILGAESAENRIADVNNDNAVNVLDLIRVKKAVAFF